MPATGAAWAACTVMLSQLDLSLVLLHPDSPLVAVQCLLRRPELQVFLRPVPDSPAVGTGMAVLRGSL